MIQYNLLKRHHKITSEVHPVITLLERHKNHKVSKLENQCHLLGKCWMAFKKDYRLECPDKLFYETTRTFPLQSRQGRLNQIAIPSNIKHNAWFKCQTPTLSEQTLSGHVSNTQMKPCFCCFFFLHLDTPNHAWEDMLRAP